MTNHGTAISSVNLALGGGGAKGFVHLGVLKELTDQDIEIASIVGTSIGAIIGALFAHYKTWHFQDKEPLKAQKEAAAMVSDLFVKTNFWQLADLNIFGALKRGFLKGGKADEWLRKLLIPVGKELESLRFSQLPFDLTITATNAHTGESLVLNRNKHHNMFVHKAVRASMSIQYVFKEIALEINNTPILCWDGGTTGNCRFDLAAKLYPGRPTIASTLTYRGEIVSPPKRRLGRLYSIQDHTISILMKSVEEIMLNCLPDEIKKSVILVRPDLEGVGTYNFEIDAKKRLRLIKNGQLATKEALENSVITTTQGGHEIE